MSSPEGSTSTLKSQPAPKRFKRDAQRACDACRRRKGDGPEQSDHKCTTCRKNRLQCTYVERSNRQEPKKSYVQSLETRLRTTELLLRKFCPQVDIDKELGPSVLLDDSSASPSAPEKSPVQLPLIAPRGELEDAMPPSSDDEVGIVQLNDPPRKIQHKMYFGKSSGFHLIHSVLDHHPDRTPGRVVPITIGGKYRRPEFWCHPTWELISEARERVNNTFELPPPDLLAKLLDAYFTKINILTPILHRDLLDCQLLAGLHRKDEKFMAVVLLVCAVASRSVDDVRVLVAPDLPRSAGWKYFEQVEHLTKPRVSGFSPRLFDLQICALASNFLFGTSLPGSNWTSLGMGIRMAQEVGAHRKKVYKEKSNLVDELWKRAFWNLVAWDRQVSAGFGRPCAIQDESFDVELPLEVDDDCWDLSDPTNNFPLKHDQPAGKPSTMAYFVSLQKLYQIMAFALRTIYSINKSKVLLGYVGPEWEQQIVKQLDQSLDEWAATVPAHLMWDPRPTDPVFYKQAGALWATYYNMRIFTHRQSIQPNLKLAAGQPNRPISLHSLHICTIAASAASSILAETTEEKDRGRDGMMMDKATVAFMSCIILLLGIWTESNLGLLDEAGKKLRVEAVERCLLVVKRAEKTWHAAGKARDVLLELCSSRDVSLEEHLGNSVLPGQPRAGEGQRLRPILPRPPPTAATASTSTIESGYAVDPRGIGSLGTWELQNPGPSSFNDTAVTDDVQSSLSAFEMIHPHSFTDANTIGPGFTFEGLDWMSLDARIFGSGADIPMDGLVETNVGLPDVASWLGAGLFGMVQGQEHSGAGGFQVGEQPEMDGHPMP